MTLLLNDLWAFDVDGTSTLLDNEDGIASRVAACSSIVDRPRILSPISRVKGGRVAYPGGRFHAATWSHEEHRHKACGTARSSCGVGWMFGGVGQRTTSYRGVEFGDNCNLENMPGDSLRRPMTNLCDVWMFVPGSPGFRLVAARERDLPELNDAGLVPSTIVPMGLGPTAGILTAGWTGLTPASSSAGDRAGAGTPAGGQSLWMFGGVTDGMRGIRRYRAARRDTARVRGRPLPVCQSHHVRYLGAQRTGADCSSRHTVSERGLHRGSLAL